MYNNIPLELRALNQWVVSRDDKVPLNPRTSQKAAVDDPSTWGSFEEATRSGLMNIGFVLTANDPYAIIDLDNKPTKPCTPEQLERHQRILSGFDSYTERSMSGTGYHIIVKGSIPKGVNKDNVEIYSSGHYLICTGNVIRNSPIVEYQEFLTAMYNQMQATRSVELDETLETNTDEEIIEIALNASNGDKFNELCNGDWAAMGYTSQSEADFALMSIIAFYSHSNEQVRRLFRLSNLGRRDKATRNDKYLDYALEKIRANQPALINFDDLKIQVQPIAEAPPVLAEYNPLNGIQPPPGLIGEIAAYIYQTAVRPVPEVAIAAAIAFAAGICGRSYNISGTGLNQYMVLLAKTGTGKEGATSGIDNLVNAIRPQIPMVDQFIGPGAFASGQAIIKVLDTKPCFVSVLSEFSLVLKQLCDPRANGPQMTYKKVLLDLYSKSGWGKVLRSSVYADSEKNTKTIQAPNVTLLGECTPEGYYGMLDSSHISEGWIPRFSVIEYLGPRPARNKNANSPPPDILVNRVCELIVVSLSTSSNNTCANIQIDSKALSMMDEFDVMADSMINGSNSDVEAQLWNRAHLKVLKLAALIAVGCNPHAPVINEEAARWALDFVNRDVMTMVNKFKREEMGQGEHLHESDIRRVVEQYLEMTLEQRASYKVPAKVIEHQVVPFHYLRRKVRLLSAFKNDRRGVAKALQDSLDDMVKAEILNLVPPIQCMQKFGTSAPLYAVGSTW